MRRTPLIVTLGLASVVCLGIAHFSASAQDPTPEKDTSSQPKLGGDWRKLRDSLDGLFDQLHKEKGIKAANIANDAVFIRRVYLDLLGRPPSPSEIDAFAPERKRADGLRGQAKREALIDELMATKEYAEHFAAFWRVVMVGRGDNWYDRSLESYLGTALHENRSWSQITTELVAAKGRTPENPAIGFLGSFENDKAAMTGITAKVFLGKQIQCAECHEHPYEDWSTDDFEAMQGFFRLFSVGARGEGAQRYWFSQDTEIHNRHDVSAKVRLRGKYKLPKYLGGDEYEFRSGETLRDSLATWMTSADNKWFREMTVNRYMAYFLGLGFVTPVDDFNSINEPTFPVVLEVMGKDFAASGFDLRYLIRAITTSKLYQRETSLNRSNRNDWIYYSRGYVRKLTPEQVENSIRAVVGIEALNPFQPVRDVPDSKLTDDEKRNKAIANAVNGWKNNLHRLMRDAYNGDPEIRELSDYDGTLIQALLLMNAPLLGPASLDNNLKKILRDYGSHKDRVYQIFMTVLGRKPTKDDIALINGFMPAWTGQDEQRYEDLFMALMNTTEFATNK